MASKQPCPHCGQDLNLPPDATEKISKLAEENAEARKKFARIANEASAHDEISHRKLFKLIEKLADEGYEICGGDEAMQVPTEETNE